MSYEPTNWKSGDIVTSEKLNKLEQGIATSSSGNGVMIVGTVSENNTFRLDKTWKEINDAIKTSVVHIYTEGLAGNMQLPVLSTAVDSEDGSYAVIALDMLVGQVMEFVTDTENGYPVIEDEPLAPSEPSEPTFS